MPRTTQNEDLNFTVPYFNECLNTCFPNQPLPELINIYAPLQMEQWSQENFNLTVALFIGYFLIRNQRLMHLLGRFRVPVSLICFS